MGLLEWALAMQSLLAWGPVTPLTVWVPASPWMWGLPSPSEMVGALLPGVGTLMLRPPSAL